MCCHTHSKHHTSPGHGCVMCRCTIGFHVCYHAYCSPKTLVEDFSTSTTAPQDRDTYCTHLESLGHRNGRCRAHGTCSWGLLAQAVDGGLVCGGTVKKACVVEPNRTTPGTRMAACTHTKGQARVTFHNTTWTNAPCVCVDFTFTCYLCALDTDGQPLDKRLRVSMVGIFWHIPKGTRVPVFLARARQVA